MDVLQAARIGMMKSIKKVENKSKVAAMLNAAEELGYAGVAAHSGRTYKQYGCPTCRKNTAIKLVHVIKTKAVIACPLCGYRKKVSV